MDNIKDTTWLKEKNNGSFGVKYCYQLLLNNGTNELKRSLQRGFGRQKLAIFGWIATHEACLTQNKLQKNEVFICAAGFLCEEDIETANLFFYITCFTGQIWSMFRSSIWHQLGDAGS